ncbi:MAG TPA: hypothetical protein VFQ52_00120 [Rhizomicrobium sp.]|nr:hypothetical protein [Rhizomicrobium sp.]
MAANWARHGYQLVEKQGGNEVLEQPERAAWQPRSSLMTGMVPSQIPKMRVLASRLRAQAQETTVALYRRKLDFLASELEEAATEAETREAFFCGSSSPASSLHGKRNDRGHGH